LGLVIDRSEQIVVHKPALYSNTLELSVEEWQRQFDPQFRKSQ
jgi:hypothetical protein